MTLIASSSLPGASGAALAGVASDQGPVFTQSSFNIYNGSLATDGSGFVYQSGGSYAAVEYIPISIAGTAFTITGSVKVDGTAPSGAEGGAFYTASTSTGAGYELKATPAGVWTLVNNDANLNSTQIGATYTGTALGSTPVAFTWTRDASGNHSVTIGGVAGAITGADATYTGGYLGIACYGVSTATNALKVGAVAASVPSGQAVQATGYTLAASPASVVDGSPVTITATLTGGTTLATTLVITLVDSLGSTISGTISVAAGSMMGTATVNPSTPGTHAITATHTGGGFTGGDGSASFTSTAPGTLYPVTAAAVLWSPGNWFSNGTGVFQGNNVLPGSTFALTPNPGAYLRVNLESTTATGSISLQLDTSILHGIAAGSCPLVAWSIDGGDFQTSQLVYGTSPTTLPLGSGLAAGLHTLEFYFASVDTTSATSMGDRWTNSTTNFSGVKVTGIYTDANSTLAAPSTRPLRALWVGDSSLESVQNQSASQGVTGQDAGQGYGYLSQIGLDAEIGIVGCASQGYEQTGFGNVPPLYNASATVAAWPYYFAGASRLAQPLDLLINSHGINGVTAASDVQGWLTQARSLLPTVKILLLVPWNGTSRAAITSGFDAYVAANPTDLAVFLIDPQTIPTGPAFYYVNPNHPNTRGDAAAASGLVGAMRAALAAPTTTVLTAQQVTASCLAAVQEVFPATSFDSAGLIKTDVTASSVVTQLIATVGPLADAVSYLTGYYDNTSVAGYTIIYNRAGVEVERYPSTGRTRLILPGNVTVGPPATTS